MSTFQNEKCACGKIRGNLNFTNWTRHAMACKMLKNKNASGNIKKFFKRSLDTLKSNQMSKRRPDNFPEHNLNWQEHLYAQAYDGAASMQGQYSGLKTLIQQYNSKAIYIWCFTHLLNLVVVDTADSCLDTRLFLGDLQTLISFIRARKRTAEFVECQKKLHPTERVQKMKSFSDTRWASHGRVINVIYSKFEALMQCLINLSQSEDRVTASGAKNNSNILSTFKFVLTLILLKKIFAITTPLSNYLQSKSLDFIEALHLVNVSEKQLAALRSDTEYKKTVIEAKDFAIKHNLSEKYFKETRRRITKNMPGEKAADEVLCLPFDHYRCNTYFEVLDKIKTSIQSRFSGAREILKDLALLSPERLEFYRNNNKPLPDDSISKLANWLIGIDLDQIKKEYTVFCKSYKELLAGANLLKLLHEKSNDIHLEYESDMNDESESDEETEQNKTFEEKMSIDRILYILSTYDLQAAFPNLHIAFKALGTLPVSSSSAERSFSKVKLIKSRLRSTMGQNRLESLMFLSCERDISIDYEGAINNFGNTSKVLKNALIYK